MAKERKVRKNLENQIKYTNTKYRLERRHKGDVGYDIKALVTS